MLSLCFAHLSLSASLSIFKGISYDNLDVFNNMPHQNKGMENDINKYIYLYIKLRKLLNYITDIYTYEFFEGLLIFLFPIKDQIHSFCISPYFGYNCNCSYREVFHN